MEDSKLKILCTASIKRTNQVFCFFVFYQCIFVNTLTRTAFGSSCSLCVASHRSLSSLVSCLHPCCCQSSAWAKTATTWKTSWVLFFSPHFMSKRWTLKLILIRTDKMDISAVIYWEPISHDDDDDIPSSSWAPEKSSTKKETIKKKSAHTDEACK